MQLRFKSESSSLEIDLGISFRFSPLEDDFKTDTDLRVACLILSKQVKLINGNEGNILIPQNWISNHREQQQHEKQKPEVKSETIILPMPSRRATIVHSKKSFSLCLSEIETPKIIGQGIPRPQSVLKAGE